MKWMIKILCLILTLIMLLGVVGCKKDKDKDGDGSGGPNGGDTTTGGEVLPEDEIFELPADTYYGNNRRFNMLLRSNEMRAKTTDEWFVGETLAEDADIVDRAVFNREITIETQLGIEFNYIFADGADEQQVIDDFRADAGLNEFHICGLGAAQAPKLIQDGLCYNLYDVPHIALDKVWWGSRSGMAQDLTINDRLYMISGDASLMAQGKALAMYINKNQLEVRTSLKITDIYNVVNAGEWTIDKLLEMSKGITADTKKDGFLDENDVWGNNIYMATILDGYFAAFNIDIVTNDGGIYFVALNTPSMVTACDKLYDLIYEEDRTWVAKDGAGNLGGKQEQMNFFQTSHAVFCHGGFEWATDGFRFMSDDYGIIPYPKLNVEQQRYGSMLSDVYTVFVIPATQTENELEFTGAVMETLAHESYYTTTEAYYEILLKQRSTRDEESKAMLDLIHDCIDYNIGYSYSSVLDNPVKAFNAVLADKNNTYFNNFSGYYTAKTESFAIKLTAMLGDYGVSQ